MLDGEYQDVTDRYIYILEILIEYGLYDIGNALIYDIPSNISSARLFYNISVIKFNMDDLDIAITYINRAIQLENSIAEYHYYLGELLNIKGKYEDSERAFLEAINLDDTVWYYYSRLSGLYGSQEKNELAIRYMNKAIELNPSPDNFKILEWYLERVERYAETCEVYKKPLK